jgi:hypothetical protein
MKLGHSESAKRERKRIAENGHSFAGRQMKEPWGHPRALDTRTPTTLMSSNPTIGHGALPNRKEAAYSSFFFG